MKHFNPGDYDRWYLTPLGMVSGRVEKDLISSLAGVKKGGKALDVGCGTGIYCIELARKGALATGVDDSKEMLAHAREKAAQEGLAAGFIRADALALPFPDDCFDTVLSVGMLCFIREREMAVSEMRRVLKPGGRLVIGVLNRWSPWAVLRRIKALFRKTVYEKADFISPPELELSLARAGLRVTGSRTCLFFLPIDCRMYLALSTPIERLGNVIAPRMGAFLAVSAIKA